VILVVVRFLPAASSGRSLFLRRILPYYSHLTARFLLIFSYFKNFFHKLQLDGFYESDLLSDRVVFLFVFVPILRHELHSYVKTHNNHTIRPQLARANHIPGKPDELYEDTSIYRRWSFTPNEELLSQLEEAVSYIGKKIRCLILTNTNLL
jgi:hypothetical protein